MTTPILEKYLTSTVRNFGVDSMFVLKELVAESDETTLNADVEFVERVKIFFRNSDNVWRKRKGVYIKNDPESVALRERTMEEISFKMGISTYRVQGIITRVMNSVARTLNNKRTFDEAIEVTHGDITQAMQNIYDEA